MTSLVPSLRNFTLEELKKQVLSFGEKAYRASQMAHWLYKKSAVEVHEMTDLSKGLISRLAAGYVANALCLVSKSVSETDGSVKYLFRTQDEHFLESVLILQGSRKTLCLSTQIGCKMGCRFCASGQEGLIRHLSCGEILDQIACVAKDQGKPPTNLVYMGMGEPLDNYDAVVKSIRIANAPWGFEIGQRRITLSTVGVIPGIKKLAEENLSQIKLSFSLHSPDPKTRTRLMPSGRKYRLPEILEVLQGVRDRFKRRITMEYILIAGVTDRNRDATKLASISRSLKAKVNLIPYNRIEGVDFERPSEDRIRAFQRKLEAARIRTTVRYSAGQDIEAACGQLRLLEERKSRVHSPRDS